jgi:hypothetical protein
MKAQVGSIASWIDAKEEEMKARVSATQHEMEVTMKCSQEETDDAIYSIQSELEETIKHWLEDILACVDQRTQGLCKELKEKIDEMQVDLQAVKTSIDMWTGRFKDNITDANKGFLKGHSEYEE